MKILQSLLTGTSILTVTLALSADTTVSSKTVVSGEVYQVQDPVRIGTSGTVQVQSGGSAAFRSSGAISLQPGFTTAAGGFFQAAIIQSYQVPLAWAAAGGSVTGYNIYRDGVKLNGTPVTGTTYTDTTAQPGRAYTYTIKAVSGSGETPLVTYAVATANSFEVFTALAR